VLYSFSLGLFFVLFLALANDKLISFLLAFVKKMTQLVTPWFWWWWVLCISPRRQKSF